MTPHRQQIINSVLDQRQPDLTVITESVVKERNLAAIVRTCDAVGIQDVHCVSPDDDYRRNRGTSASADKYVDVRLYQAVEEALLPLKRSGHQIVAAHLSERAIDYRAIDYRAVDYTKPTAILMGNELSGVQNSTAQLCDAEITIPMMGMVESFNVSVACAIILAEAQGQRQRAGAYEKATISKAHRETLFFRWAYPKLARYCDERGLVYPPLDSKGHLIPGTAPIMLSEQE